MIIEMVTRKIGKYTSGKMKPGYAVLMSSVRADLHSTVVTSGISHLSQHLIYGQRIWGGMVSVIRCRLHIIAHRRQKSGLISEQPRHLIDESCSSGLAVCAGHPHKMQFPRRIAPPLRSYVSESDRARRHHHIGHGRGYLLGQTLTYHY